MTSSIVFLNGNPPIFFYSDSPFNCINDSINILLSYIRKFLRKKIINLEKINFITNKNQSKNQVGKSNSQMLLSISFVCVFLNGNPLFFSLDSDSPFNCINDSIKILLSYIRKFLRKKIINLEKINFITNKNKLKNQVGKSNSQMLLSISFVCVICYLFYKTFSKMTHLTETQRIEILILIGCRDKTR
jgi:hypothetical protein